MSKRPDSVLLRAALHLHTSLCAYHRRLPPLTLSEGAWADCLQLLRQRRRAESRRWHGALRHLDRQLRKRLVHLQSDLHQQLLILDRLTSQPRVSPVAEIVRDLAALHEEFAQTRIDLRRRAVSVETDPIVLEGVPLGAFQIRLQWSRADALPDYGVFAVKPHVAASDDSLTHPHVQSDQLCEGDGKPAIRAALAGGRLLDFFLLVRQILETYNSASAYLPLDEWEACRCGDCGDAVAESDTACCLTCETLLCRECCGGCAGCCEDYCYGCLARCTGCEQSYCRSCLDRCPDCQGDRCADCLAESGRCADCRASDDDDHVESETCSGVTSPAQAPPDAPAQAPPTIANPEVHPDRLGEAAVPARSGRHRDRRVWDCEARRSALCGRRAARPADLFGRERHV